MGVIKDKTVINRIRRATTRKGKRVLESKEPQVIETTKSAIFTRGSTASQTCVQLLKDFCLLKKPNSVFYNRKESWHPFDDYIPLEKLSARTNSSLFAYGSHAKKRPHNLVIGRTFDDHVLDMVEFGIDADTYKPLNSFKVPKIPIGTKPIVLFSGQPFDVESDYQRIKNMLLDLFAGPQVDSIRLSGLEHVIQFVAADGRIAMRSYTIALKKSGTRLPRIELEEMGPRVDLTVRRLHLASQDFWKRALRQPEETRKKAPVKNIAKDPFGSTLGRIHMRRQDYKGLSLRKSRAFRKSSKEGSDSKSKKRSRVPIDDSITTADTNHSDDNQSKKKVRFES